MQHARTPLRVRVARGPGSAVAVVHVTGELDIASAQALRSRLRDLLEPRRPDPVTSLVLDLADLEFVDVSGLSVLLEAEELLRPCGGEVVLLDPSPVLARVVAVLGLGTRLRLAAGRAA